MVSAFLSAAHHCTANTVPHVPGGSVPVCANELIPQSDLAHEGESLLVRIQRLAETATGINEDEALLGWEVRITGGAGGAA